MFPLKLIHNILLKVNYKHDTFIELFYFPDSVTETRVNCVVVFSFIIFFFFLFKSGE